MSFFDKLSEKMSNAVNTISENAARVAEENAAKKEEEAAPVDVDFFMPLEEAKTARVTADVLNVRGTPSTAEARLGTLKRGDTVTVKALCDDWLGIDFDGRNAYVFAAYTDFDKPEFTVTASSLNVRKGPGTDTDVIGSLPNGTAVRALAEKSGWTKILYNGKIGYVARKYLKG